MISVDDIAYGQTLVDGNDSQTDFEKLWPEVVSSRMLVVKDVGRVGKEEACPTGFRIQTATSRDQQATQIDSAGPSTTPSEQEGP